MTVLAEDPRLPARRRVELGFWTLGPAGTRTRTRGPGRHGRIVVLFRRRSAERVDRASEPGGLDGPPPSDGAQSRVTAREMVRRGIELTGSEPA